MAPVAGTEVAALNLEHGTLLNVQKTGRPEGKAGRVFGGTAVRRGGELDSRDRVRGIDFNAEKSFLCAIDPKIGDVTILDTRSDQVVDRIATRKGTIRVQGHRQGRWCSCSPVSSSTCGIPGTGRGPVPSVQGTDRGRRRRSLNAPDPQRSRDRPVTLPG